MPHSLRVYKVFVASPSDVTTERRAIFRAIEEINHIYESQNKDYRLEIWAWEKSHPDWGAPQEVIKKQIPIDQCDIFIGVFWKRFGKPTGSIRPSDGRPYLSGTEEEIELATAARTENPFNRPIIMLYRKTDPISVEMTDEDLDQLRKVSEFFRKIESDTENTALVKKTRNRGFRRMLKDDLLRAVARIESQHPQSPKTPTTDDSSTHYGFDQKEQVVTNQTNIYIANATLDLQQQIADEGEFRSWYDRVGLKGNPFQHLTAEDDTQLSDYLIQPQILRHLETQIRGDSDFILWIIFANRGYGKTALRSLIAQSRYPIRQKDDLLCIVFDRDALETVVERANGSLENVEAIHYIQVMQDLVLQSLKEHECSKTISEHLSWTNDSHSVRHKLKDLTSILLQHGFKGLLCLIDQVDEVSITKAQPEEMVQLLYPFIDLTLQATPGTAFRFFLPKSLEDNIRKQTNTLRLVRCKFTHLKWEDDDLKRLIAQRLSVYSRSPASAYTSLGQLCEPESNFSARIDQMLVQTANGNPRATVWLANCLFETHCQIEKPSRRIQPATWQEVLANWEKHGRDYIFGPSPEHEGFTVDNGVIYFQGQEVRLTEKSTALLLCLIHADGGICSQNTLIRAGWPSDNPEGVSNDALIEAIRRMKNEIREKKLDPKWICNARGQGYYLCNPEDASKSAARQKSEGETQ